MKKVMMVMPPTSDDQNKQDVEKEALTVKDSTCDVINSNGNDEKSDEATRCQTKEGLVAETSSQQRLPSVGKPPPLPVPRKLTTSSDQIRSSPRRAPRKTPRSAPSNTPRSVTRSSTRRVSRSSTRLKNKGGK